MTPRSKRALSTLLCSFGTVVVVTAAMQPSAQQATGGRSHSSSRIWQAVATGAEPRSRKIAQDDLNRQRVQLCNIESRSGTLLSAETEAQLCISAVIPEEFRTAYPKLWTWIQKTLAFYEGNARPVASMHFARLPLYFDRSLLETVKFIAIDRPPMPPLTAMGLSRYAAFEQGNFDGITYLDRYFIKRTVVTEEGLHFHELIHVIQWRLLGAERFLATYAQGLDEFGYENSPLEKMAYDAEAIFKRSPAIFDAEKFVAEQFDCL